VELAEGETRRPVPKDWLDDFFMRNFIGLSMFDEVLVTGDGLLETSLAVEPEQVREHFEKWLRDAAASGWRATPAAISRVIATDGFHHDGRAARTLTGIPFRVESSRC
jgi:hypothetical protein